MRIGLVQEIKDGKWNSMLGPEGITAIIALFRIYFTSCWLEVYDKVSLNSLPRVLEIAPGQFDPIPQSLEIASSGSGEYVTANLNRQLSARLRENTKALNIICKGVRRQCIKPP